MARSQFSRNLANAVWNECWGRKLHCDWHNRLCWLRKFSKRLCIHLSIGFESREIIDMKQKLFGLLKSLVWGIRITFFKLIFFFSFYLFLVLFLFSAVGPTCSNRYKINGKMVQAYFCGLRGKRVSGGIFQMKTQGKRPKLNRYRTYDYGGDHDDRWYCQQWVHTHTQTRVFPSQETDPAN